jgi:hypothetical protein
MPKTYEPISTQTLGTATGTVNFNSIPQNYTDLILISNIRISGTGGEGASLRFNSDTSSNYSYTRLFASSSVTSDRGSNLTADEFGYYPGDDSTSGLFGIGVTQIQNYSNTTTFKPYLLRWNNNQNVGTQHVGLTSGLYRSTSAINSITLTANVSKNFVIGCSFTLYGIRGA